MPNQENAKSQKSQDERQQVQVVSSNKGSAVNKTRDEERRDENTVATPEEETEAANGCRDLCFLHVLVTQTTEGVEVTLLDVLCLACLFVVEAEAVDCGVRRSIHCLHVSLHVFLNQSTAKGEGRRTVQRDSETVRVRVGDPVEAKLGFDLLALLSMFGRRDITLSDM